MTTFTEYAPMLTADGEQTVAAIEDAIAADAPAARAYFARVGALDLAAMQGIPA
mgnify:CR=1 FL=1